MKPGILNFILEGSRVERYHARPLLKPDTNGRHSHGVAMLCYLMANENPSVNLLMAALTHDLAEQATGDVPGPAKWILDSVADRLDAMENFAIYHYDLSFPLGEEDKLILKWADCLDGLLACIHDYTLGNRYMHVTVQRWLAHLDKLDVPNPVAKEIYDTVIAMWRVVAAGSVPTYDVYREVPFVGSER